MKVAPSVNLQSYIHTDPEIITLSYPQFMDHLTIFDLLETVKLQNFQVKSENRGTVVHARYDGFKKDGITPAPRFIELLIESRTDFTTHKLRWRTGFLYNERAVFRTVQTGHKDRWLKFAMIALGKIREERAKELVTIDTLRLNLLR